MRKPLKLISICSFPRRFLEFFCMIISLVQNQSWLPKFWWNFVLGLPKLIANTISPFYHSIIKRILNIFLKTLHILQKEDTKVGSLNFETSSLIGWRINKMILAEAAKYLDVSQPTGNLVKRKSLIYWCIFIILSIIQGLNEKVNKSVLSCLIKFLFKQALH